MGSKWIWMLWGESRGKWKRSVAGSRRELNPGHIWLEPPVLCHWATDSWTTTNPHNPLYVLHRRYTYRVPIHIEDCEGWWLSGCHGSVAEHWRLKLEVSWVRLPATASLGNFLPCWQRAWFLFKITLVTQRNLNRTIQLIGNNICLSGERGRILITTNNNILYINIPNVT